MSEEALWYGIKMQAQSGGRVRQAIKASNTFERRLLPDVIHPQDAGVRVCPADRSQRHGFRVQLPVAFLSCLIGCAVGILHGRMGGSL